MSEFRHARWDFGAAKAQYREDELQLRQPKGFPIIPLPSTVARAFEEAEIAAAARNYAEPEFDIYEDAHDSRCNTTANACDKTVGTEPRTTMDEEGDDGKNGDENEQANNENAHEAHPSDANVIKDGQNSGAPVDTLGRTRAATSRRKALETIQIEDSLESIEEDDGNSKKRKRGHAQRSTQPRKKSVRKPH